jgi:hypothetical protein
MDMRPAATGGWTWLFRAPASEHPQGPQWDREWDVNAVDYSFVTTTTAAWSDGKYLSFFPFYLYHPQPFA